MDMRPILGLREPVSSLTHLATAVFVVYVTMLLWRLTSGDAAKRQAMLVYGLSMIALYTASGVYHAIPGHYYDPNVCFFRRVDVSAIFLMIAGSFTPIIVVLLTGRLRTVMLVLIWSLAAAGITLKWAYPSIPHPITVCTFAVAGLPGFLPIRQYWRALDGQGLGWVLSGCLCFALGGVFDVADWPTPIPGLIHAHEITHLLDMAGSAMHVIFMVRFIIPFAPAVPSRRLFGQPAGALVTANA
jgi:hemolysin III